jgi:hypothetical protein
MRRIPKSSRLSDPTSAPDVRTYSKRVPRSIPSLRCWASAKARQSRHPSTTSFSEASGPARQTAALLQPQVARSQREPCVASLSKFIWRNSHALQSAQTPPMTRREAAGREYPQLAGTAERGWQVTGIPNRDDGYMAANQGVGVREQALTRFPDRAVGRPAAVGRFRA